MAAIIVLVVIVFRLAFAGLAAVLLFPSHPVNACLGFIALYIAATIKLEIT